MIPLVIDNFDAFDTALWTAETRTGPNLQSRRVPENVVIRDGRLMLLVRRNGKGDKPWTTAYVQSQAHFLYGYFEARFRYADGAGLNNAFWMMTDEPSDRGGREVDINEGQEPGLVRTNIHTPRMKSAPGVHQLDPSTNREFNTYGLRWEPEGSGARLTWYLNGKEIRREHCPDCVRPMRLIFSTAINRIRTPAHTLDGSAMEVDWVRAYALR